MVPLAWLSLVGLLAGDAGVAIGRRTGIEPRWAWLASSGGWLCLAAHMLVAMAVHHGWSHEAAVAETALLTRQVYGIAWGGGVYVNYAFLVLWLAYLRCWRTTAGALPTSMIWTWRVAVLVVVSNAAIVFAVPARRPGGAIVMAALIASWWISARPARAGG